MDTLANAASVAERHANAYWIKELAFRAIRSRLGQARAAEPSQAATLDALEKELTRLYYLGRFDRVRGATRDCRVESTRGSDARVPARRTVSRSTASGYRTGMFR